MHEGVWPQSASNIMSDVHSHAQLWVKTCWLMPFATESWCKTFCHFDHLRTDKNGQQSQQIVLDTICSKLHPSYTPFTVLRLIFKYSLSHVCWRDYLCLYTFLSWFELGRTLSVHWTLDCHRHFSVQIWGTRWTSNQRWIGAGLPPVYLFATFLKVSVICLAGSSSLSELVYNVYCSTELFRLLQGSHAPL